MRIDFYIARLRASSPAIRLLAFLFERRSHETASLCKSINGTSNAQYSAFFSTYKVDIDW